MFHTAEDAAVVGGRSKYQMTAAECFGNKHGWVSYGYIIHGNVSYASFCQAAGKDVCCIFCVSVNRSVSDHNRLFFRNIAAPCLVFIHVPADIGTPYRTMQRAKDLNVQRSHLFKECLCRRTIFSHNIGIVSSGIIQPVTFKIHFVCE